MIKRKVRSQGFELDWLVPATVSEYDGLAPKRTVPCLDDAIDSTWYRNGANKFRDGLCEYVEKETGVKRLNAGTEDEPKWENEGKFLKRAVAEVAKARGLDPAAKGVSEAIRAEWAPTAQTILDGIKFDPSEQERTGGGNLIAKTYIEWATKAVAGLDGGAKLAGLLAKAINSPVELVGDGAKGKESEDVKTLSKAIAANEKRKRDELAAQSKAEYGLEDAIATA